MKFCVFISLSMFLMLVDPLISGASNTSKSFRGTSESMDLSRAWKLQEEIKELKNKAYKAQIIELDYDEPPEFKHTPVPQHSSSTLFRMIEESKDNLRKLLKLKQPSVLQAGTSSQVVHQIEKPEFNEWYYPEDIDLIHRVKN